MVAESADDFYVVAIGASAGGLGPIKSFFRNVPEAAREQQAFVVIQHLADDHISMMPDILMKETQMPVVEVTHGLKLLPRSIYLIPPGANLELRDTANGLVFGLLERATKPTVNLPIDIFLNALAHRVQSRGVAVILSGAGSDGSRGVAAVKAVDGIVIAQDPKTAEFDSMPLATINTSSTDYILEPHEMPVAISNYIMRRGSDDGAFEDALLHDPAGVTHLLLSLSDANPDWQVQFAGYKRPMVCRRIAKRMMLTNQSTLDRYAALVASDANEAGHLASELLVSVTEFFRDPEAWRVLAEQVIPNIIHDDGPEAKIWSAGCCTGEEAYSLAMLCDEYCRANNISRNFRVVATDLDSAALEQASRGVYPVSIEECISPERLKKYFSRTGRGYEVSTKLRSKVLFSRHDLIDSPPFVYVDLLVCRNVLIYLNRDIQDRLLDNFGFSLRRDGFLFLGPSESLGTRSGSFSAVERIHRIFRNRKIPITKAMSQVSKFPSVRSYQLPAATRLGRRSLQAAQSRAMLRAVLAQSPGMCAVVVDEEWKVLESAGDYKRFLHMPEDGFSADLLSMMPERAAVSLGLQVRKLLSNEADEESKTTRIPFKTDSGAGHAIATLSLLGPGDQSVEKRFVLVLYDDPVTPQLSSSTDAGVEAASDNYIAELEQELADTQEFLKTTIAELEASNEELQTTNEELLSSNEELQSTYEEMQSVNEELVTVNAEFQTKNDELISLNADMASLLDSSQVATIWLDENACIRKFTPGVDAVFHLRDTDLQRPLAHFTPDLSAETSKNLGAGISAVLNGEKDLVTYESRNQQGNWFSIRVVPFFSPENERAGAVLNFIDVDELKNVQAELADRSIALESVLENTLAGFWDWHIQDDYEYMSPSFKSMFGYTDSEIPNKPDSWQKIIHPEDLPGVFEVFEAHVSSRGETPYDNTVRYFHKNGSIVWVLCRGRVVEWDEAGNPLRMVGCHVDITPLKRAEESVRRYAEDSRQLAYIASHDLREPLNTIRGFTDICLEDHIDNLSDEQATLLNRIGTAAGNMESMVTGLLDYSRIDAKDIELNTVDLEGLLKSVLSDLDSAITNAGAKITMGALPEVHSSESMLRQIFSNLVTNALKFKKAGEVPTLTISGETTRSEIRISVQDNGIGIEEEHQKKIFELFQRLHTRTDYPGSGIGLAVCRRIANLCGGEMTVQSQTGVGSTFTLQLPRVTPVA